MVVQVPPTRSTLVLLFLAISLVSCSPFGQKGSTAAPTPVPTVVEGPIPAEASAADRAATDQTAEQPSLPGGSVVMGNDPHGTSKMIAEAEADVLCKETAGNAVQVRLTGGLKDVDEALRGQRVFLRVSNNGTEVIDLPLDGDFRFSQTFWAHAPLSFKFRTFDVIPDEERPVFNGLSNPPVPGEIASMVGCPENTCNDWTWDNSVVHFANSESDVSLAECGVPKGWAEAALVCQDTAKGTVQVRFSGQLSEVNETVYPKGQLFVRVFNDVATPEFFDLRVDDQGKFGGTLEAHAPVRFAFAIRVYTPGPSRLYGFRVPVPPMIPCTADACFLVDRNDRIDRMALELRGSLVPDASLAACNAPPPDIVTVQP